MQHTVSQHIQRGLNSLRHLQQRSHAPRGLGLEGMESSVNALRPGHLASQDHQLGLVAVDPLQVLVSLNVSRTELGNSVDGLGQEHGKVESHLLFNHREPLVDLWVVGYGDRCLEHHLYTAKEGREEVSWERGRGSKLA